MKNDNTIHTITDSNLKKILLVVSDIDGTLVDSKSQISDLTIKAVNKLREVGIQFSLGTGRNNNMVRALVHLLGDDLYSISNNGALVYDHKNNKVVYSHTLTEKQSRIILTEILERRWDFICYSRTRMYYSHYDELIKTKLLQVTQNVLKWEDIGDFSYKEVKSINEIEDINHLYKIGVLESSEVDFKVVQQIAQSVGAELKNSGKHFNAIFPSGISKEIGLMKLQEYLGIGPDNTAAIGDFDNDLPLFARAAHRIAMGNASDIIRKASTQQTDSNDEDGVAHYLDSIISQFSD